MLCRAQLVWLAYHFRSFSCFSCRFRTAHFVTWPHASGQLVPVRPMALQNGFEHRKPAPAMAMVGEAEPQMGMKGNDKQTYQGH